MGQDKRDRTDDNNSQNPERIKLLKYIKQKEKQNQVLIKLLEISKNTKKQTSQ